MRHLKHTLTGFLSVKIKHLITGYHPEKTFFQKICYFILDRTTMVSCILMSRKKKSHIKLSSLVKKTGLEAHIIRSMLQHKLVGIARIDFANSGIKQTEIVINFRHSANRGTRVFRNGFLLDSNGRSNSFNTLYVRPRHAFEELANIG